MTSSLSSILSDGDDDDVQIVSVENEPKVKQEIKTQESVVELSTGDEDTQTEPDNIENEGLHFSSVKFIYLSKVQVLHVS